MEHRDHQEEQRMHPDHEEKNDSKKMAQGRHEEHRHKGKEGQHPHEGMSGDHDGSMAHAGHINQFKKKFFVSLLLAIPIFVLSPMMGMTLPFQFSFLGSEWIVLIFSTILFFYGGMPFLVGAGQELKEKKPAMMTLISLGISASYFYSLYAVLHNYFNRADAPIMDFFWELASLILIMLLGHWIEMKAVSDAGDALEKMAQLLPSKVSVKQGDGGFLEIPLRELKVGQIAMVKANEKIPADGVVIEGDTYVNESLVTGEAREVHKQEGDSVVGGSQNGLGSVLIEVTGTGESGYLAQVMQLVQSAREEKSKAETMSDKVARWLFFAAVVISIIAFVAWYAITRDLGLAVTRMVTVLIIACPHALGLAIPLVVARSTSLGAQNGLLVRKRQALEIVPKVNVVMMDKTGTLTEGHFSVKDVQTLDNSYSKEEILSLFASIETGSSHPLAQGIIHEARRLTLPTVPIENITNMPGIGIKGQLSSGQEVLVAAATYLDRQSISYDQERVRLLSEKGNSVSFLLLNGKPIGLVAQGDEIRPEAKMLIKELKQEKMTPIMLTGDNLSVAKKVADLLGLSDYRGELLPEEKEKIVSEYQQEGNVVMMVGDGVNDAPSLTRADVGVAIGAGTDVAIDSADVVLVKSNPGDILNFIGLAKNTTRKMKQNLWWGAGYNIVAIPLAAGILAPLGILLSPAVGAVLMSLSTVIVALNALTLRIEK